MRRSQLRFEIGRFERLGALVGEDRGLERCWYCLCEYSKENPKTREHLIAKSIRKQLSQRQRGRLDGKDNPFACLRCNVFVGDWLPELKLRFRLFIQEAGGWTGLEARFQPIRFCRPRIEAILWKRPPILIAPASLNP